MAAVKKQREPELTDSDKAWGYRFGCDGVTPIHDAAKFLGRSRKTIYRWAKDGKLRSGNGGVICVRSMTNFAHSLEK